MAGIDFWRLCDEYSIMHAALLIVGRQPEDIERHPDRTIEDNLPDYIAARTALISAVESERIETTKLVRFVNDYEEGAIDIRRTFISVADLRNFVRDRGFSCEAFERDLVSRRSENAPGSGYFSKKLHAANAAWIAVTSDPSRLRGKSPKQALEDWLIENAGQLGLLNRDGKPNRTGIEEISKVANWKPEGGATPTPALSGPALAPVPVTRFPPPPPVTRGFGRGAGDRPEPTREEWPADLDDEIPF